MTVAREFEFHWGKIKLDSINLSAYQKVTAILSDFCRAGSFRMAKSPFFAQSGSLAEFSPLDNNVSNDLLSSYIWGACVAMRARLEILNFYMMFIWVTYQQFDVLIIMIIYNK